jgi:1-hydroxycarotenoid 3,4-desaturase
MAGDRVIVIGAGVGGLSAAALLAARGFAVTVVERADSPGGKMRQIVIDDRPIDAGPTVFTMRWVFDRIFGEAGTALDNHVVLHRADLIARHAWSVDERLDLFADIDRSADAIGAFAGADAVTGFRAFTKEARHIYDTLEQPFLCAQRPGRLDLVRGTALRDLWRIRPYESMWRALGRYFRDPRLRQLFGRYATYSGASPFHAPATLMLIAHVEQSGVWAIEGGMHALARALEGLASRQGAAFRYGADCVEIVVSGGKAAGVVLASGERIDADHVIVNADPAALERGLLGPAAAPAVPPLAPRKRSLSAVTFTLAARTDGFPLAHHNVFFSSDYRAEFDDILKRRSLPAEPTVYLCAQDRAGHDNEGPRGPERMHLIVNAPPDGDAKPLSPAEIDRCETRTFERLEACGLRVQRLPGCSVTTTPADFHRLFPATGGALYGRASHGSAAAFQRPGARTAIPGLYLAGGGAHPGAGVPMAALSGWLATQSLIADHDSTRTSRPAAMPGGMSMR